MNAPTCPGPHEMTWWSDKCSECGHMLAAHRDALREVEPIFVVEESEPVEPAPSIVVPFGDCSMCAMQKELEASIAEQDSALRQYAERMRGEAKEFATGLQNTAKQYIDDENTRFAGIAKNYVDESISSSQNTAKGYVDTEIGKVPAWVNNRLVQVIKVEALKVDPRT